MTQALVVIPHGAALPAHLQNPNIAAEIAAANAAAAGGIKTGGFPKISIKGSKFHEVDGGETRTYMMQAAPGQPPLPMMCLEAVIIAANPFIVKTFYKGEWAEGSVEAPDCQSSNGVAPDSFVANKESAVCATCPQNQWGSKVSKTSGKDVKACSDGKQLVVLPAQDLTYKALGLAVTPAALGDWGKYVKALSDRNIPVNSVVTNITFDHTASFPRLQFAYNRFLTAEEYAKVKERALGDDVKAIITPAHPIAVMPTLAAPKAAPVLAAPASIAPTPAPVVVPAAPIAAGFGAAAPADAPAAPAAPAEAPAPKRQRAPRQPAAPAATNLDLSYLPPAIKAAVDAVGADSPGGKALLALYPAPAKAPELDAASLAAKIALDVMAVAPTPAAPAPGFGATAAAPVAPAASAAAAAVVSSAGSLKEILQKKLGITPPAAQ